MRVGRSWYNGLLAPWLSAFLWVVMFFAGSAASLLPRSVELWLGPRLGRLV
ncbi:MAG: hypothetical protein FD126_3478, partial [Elusimicrobia bacterium]